MSVPIQGPPKAIWQNALNLTATIMITMLENTHFYSKIKRQMPSEVNRLRAQRTEMHKKSPMIRSNRSQHQEQKRRVH